MNNRVNIYEPMGWQRNLGYKVDETRCRHAVHDSYGVGFHQCPRKPVETVGGFGLCRQHAKLAKEK